MKSDNIWCDSRYFNDFFPSEARLRLTVHFLLITGIFTQIEENKKLITNADIEFCANLIRYTSQRMYFCLLSILY